MSGLFSKPDMPETKTERMPDAEDPKVQAERRKRQTEMRGRGGRDSTILSENLVGSTGKLGA